MRFPGKRFDWESLRVFLAVARCRSMRAGAKSLGVGPSTVSRRIGELEADLGVRLFEAVPGGLALTELGERALAHVERIESGTFDLERDVIGQDAALAGSVRLTLPPPLAYGPLMEDIVHFGDRYPDIDVELVASYDLIDLSRREADIAIRFTDEPEDWLVGRRLPPFRDAVYATPNYIATHTFDGPEPSARWIGWTGDDARPTWVRSMPFPSCMVRWQISDVVAQAAAARAGLGMCLLPCSVGDSDDALVRVGSSEPVLERPAWILTHPDLRTTERVRLFVRYLVDALQRRADHYGGTKTV